MGTKVTVIYKVERRVQDFDTRETRIGLTLLYLRKGETVNEALAHVVDDAIPMFVLDGWVDFYDEDDPA